MLKSNIKTLFPHAYNIYVRAKAQCIHNNISKLSRKGDFKSAVEYIFSLNRWEMDWNIPKTINEKLQCLKLGEYYNNPLITECIDKIKVKGYIERHNINCKYAERYGVWEKPEEIEWEKLPNRFVIKCNHGCAYNIMCDDKRKLNIPEIITTLTKWIKEDYWEQYAEPQYKFIEKKIFVEEFLGNGDGIQTYKFYCFNGEPRVVYISNDGPRGSVDRDMYIDYYDMDFQWLNITLQNHLHSDVANEKPDNWDELKKIAKQLAGDFPFVRVDLYDIEGVVYLSELTFIPTGGYMSLSPREVQYEWGSWLSLDRRNFDVN